MLQAEITKRAGRHRRGKRVGRGAGTGRGKTCGRGHKGAGSRSGWKSRGMAEGGQMPLFRRLPKRGFSNAQFATRYNVVNLRDLERHFEDGAHVTPAALAAAGLIRHKRLGVKVLAQGALSKKLTVEATRFSGKAAERIAVAGGEAKIVGGGQA